MGDHDPRVARMLIMCQRPFHLSAVEADQWIQREAAKLLADRDVERVRFVLLQSATLAWPRQSDWLLELDLAEGAKIEEAVRGSACRELLGDLRMLGMRPSIVVAEGVVELGGE